jgi:hypothetical protein
MLLFRGAPLDVAIIAGTGIDPHLLAVPVQDTGQTTGLARREDVKGAVGQTALADSILSRLT